MSTYNDPSLSQPDAVDAIIAEIIVAEEQRGPQDRDQWIAQYPEFADELASFFAFEDNVSSLLRPPPESTLDFKPAKRIPETEAYLGSHLFDIRTAAVGDLLGGHYRVLDVKHGGMGCVYIITGSRNSDETPRCVTKTVLPPSAWKKKRDVPPQSLLARYAALQLRFQREAINWVRLPNHENILEAVMVQEIDGRPFLFLEYADSGDLAEWIRSGRMTIERTVEFALQFCIGMSHAVKRAGLVHRDIKPSNILIHQERTVKITDLGLARAFVEDDGFGAGTENYSDQDELSYAGGGTRAYMAPEQFLSLRDADTRSDVFSFGATLFEMITGCRLFNGDVDALRASSMNMPLVAPGELNPSVPKSLDGIVARCLSYQRGDRFQSFVQLAEALSATGICKRRLIRKRTSTSGADSMNREDFGRETNSRLSLRQFTAAEELARRAISADPDYGGHWANLGKAIAEQGRFEEALSYFEAATQLRPEHAYHWADLAVVLQAIERPMDALVAAQAGIRSDDKCSEAWAALGSCQLSLYGPAESICSYQRAVSLDPSNWRAFANLGIALWRVDEEEDALYYLNKSVAMNPSSLAWFQIACIYARRNEFATALVSVNKCLEVDDKHSASWSLRGMILAEMDDGDLHEAIKCLERAVELEPNDSASKSYLAQTRKRLHEPSTGESGEIT